jgi:hypothetical protein
MVIDIKQSMPPDEFISWLAYFNIKKSRAEFDKKATDQKNKPVKSKRHN